MISLQNYPMTMVATIINQPLYPKPCYYYNIFSKIGCWFGNRCPFQHFEIEPLAMPQIPEEKNEYERDNFTQFREATNIQLPMINNDNLLYDIKIQLNELYDLVSTHIDVQNKATFELAEKINNDLNLPNELLLNDIVYDNDTNELSFSDEKNETIFELRKVQEKKEKESNELSTPNDEEKKTINFIYDEDKQRMIEEIKVKHNWLFHDFYSKNVGEIKGELILELPPLLIKLANTDYSNVNWLSNFNDKHQKILNYIDKVINFCMKRKDYNRVIEVCRFYTATSQTFNIMSTAYYMIGDYDTSLIFANEAIEQNEIDKSGYEKRALAHFQLENWKDALSDFQVYEKYDKSNLYEISIKICKDRLKKGT